MLNCEICALTQYHCCKASVPYNVTEAIHLANKAEELGINIRILPSKEKKNYFNIVRKDKLFKTLDDENCIFLKNGRCIIYEDRPAICRVYGTEKVKCWFYDLDYDTPADVIFDMDKDDVSHLTKKITKENETSIIEFFKDKMKN